MHTRIRKICALVTAAFIAACATAAPGNANGAEVSAKVYEVGANQDFIQNHTGEAAVDILNLTAQISGVMRITFVERQTDGDDISFAVPNLVTDTDGANVYAGSDDFKDSLSLAVKKGDVIRVKVMTKNAYYGLKYSMEKAKAFSKAVTRGKAPVLKKNKSVQGIIYNTDGVETATWYRIKVTKKANVKVTLKYDGLGNNDDVSLSLRNRKGKKIAASSDGRKLKKKVAPGTYYIKVGKNSPASSAGAIAVGGVYKLSWK